MLISSSIAPIAPLPASLSSIRPFPPLCLSFAPCPRVCLCTLYFCILFLFPLLQLCRCFLSVSTTFLGLPAREASKIVRFLCQYYLILSFKFLTIPRTFLGINPDGIVNWRSCCPSPPRRSGTFESLDLPPLSFSSALLLWLRGSRLL